MLTYLAMSAGKKLPKASASFNP